MSQHHFGRSERVRPYREWLRPHLGERTNCAWRGLLPQAGLIAAALLLYYVVRAISKGSEATAVSNAADLLAFERAFGLDWELGAQALVLDQPALVSFFNWVYVWTYWPLLLGALVFFWVAHRHEFTIMRDALVISGAVGLMIFAVYPVAPPRFLPGFTDTVAQASREHFIAHPSGFINEYAALPSFHLGWHALAAVMLARHLPPRWRVAVMVPPALMAAAIVFTANHYVIDGVAGVGLALAGLSVARQLHSQPRTIVMDSRQLVHVDLTTERPVGAESSTSTA